MCPTIGENVAKLQIGKCSEDDQILKGKNFNITYVGFPPFIEYSEPLGGSDVQTMKLMAEKYEFTYDLVLSKTSDEMVNMVSLKN